MASPAPRLRAAISTLLLVDAAIAAGAEFMPAVRVRDGAQRRPARGHRRAAGASEPRATCPRASSLPPTAADRGWRSALGLTRFADAPRRWAFGAYFADVDGLTTRGEMHVRTDGYIGVARLAGGVTNVCVVREIAADRVHPRADRGHRTRAVVERPRLRDRFARARQVSPVSSLGPLAVEAGAAGCPGLLLAGDAAGFVDPMTGDGLRFALRGGELAAEAALVELETGMPAHPSALEAAAPRVLGQVARQPRPALAGRRPGAVQVAAAISACWARPVRYLIGVAGDIPLARS